MLGARVAIRSYNEKEKVKIIAEAVVYLAVIAAVAYIFTRG